MAERDYTTEVMEAAAATLKTLKPCPFCGGKPYAHWAVNGTQMFKVGCSPCGFEFKAAWYRGEAAPTRDLAAVWNRRAKTAGHRAPNGGTD